jgi:hypothetical protein
VKHESEYYFKVLGLPPGASARAIKQRYRRLARQHHPDVNPGDPHAEERFKQISEAYRVLIDPNRVDEPVNDSPAAGTVDRSQARQRRGVVVRPLRIGVTAGITIAFMMLVAEVMEMIHGPVSSAGNPYVAEQALNGIVRARLRTGSQFAEGFALFHGMGFGDAFVSGATKEAVLGPQIFTARARTSTVEAIIGPSSVFFVPGWEIRLVLCYNTHLELVDQSVVVQPARPEKSASARPQDDREPPVWVQVEQWFVKQSEPKFGSHPKHVTEQR